MTCLGDDMREIKFRAWDSKDSKMRTDFAVINGSARHQENPKGNSSVTVDVDGNITKYYSDWATYKPKDWPVMQYTGLKDMNGKEIYEKDVVYLAGYGNYVCEFPFLELYEAGMEGDIGEILGNVFENPELDV